MIFAPAPHFLVLCAGRTASVKKVNSIGLVGLAAISIAGCGGGGGTSNPDTPPSTTPHIYAAGDQWQYDLFGEEMLGGQNLSLSGTETQAVTSTTLSGKPVLAMTTTDNFIVNNQNVVQSTTSYVTQDPTTGAITLVADTQGPNESVRTVTKLQITQNGTLATGSTSASTLTFDDGDVEKTSQAVQGYTFLKVPAGTFNAWETLNQETDTNGVASTATQEWVPNLGAFVKAQISGTQPGFTIHFTLALTSTTVQLPQ